MPIVTPSLTYFPNAKKSGPLYNGYIYIGQVDLDPEIPENQIPARLALEDGSEVVVPQPIRTGDGGLIQYEATGDYAVLLADGDFSLKALYNDLSLAYYIPKNYGIFDVAQLLGIQSVADFTELRVKLSDDSFPVGILFLVLSPSGFLYEKKEGVAVDDGLSIITENGGATVSDEHYGEITGAAAVLPDYATDGEFYTDTGVADAYVLNLQSGRLPLTELRDGMKFRFRVSLANVGSGGTTTVDLSACLGQTVGTTVKEINTGAATVVPGYAEEGEVNPVSGEISNFIDLTYCSDTDNLVLHQRREATQAEVDSGANVSAFITPDKLALAATIAKAVTADLDTKGFVRIPVDAFNELLIEWGTTANIDNDSDAWINSPTNYSESFTTVLAVFGNLTSTDASGGPNTDPYFSVRNHTSTTFQYRTNNLSGTNQIVYLAVGRKQL